MRIDFIHEDGRECWACFDDKGNLIQLACKSLDLRLILRDPAYVTSGIHGYEWHHWPLEGELALYATRLKDQRDNNLDLGFDYERPFTLPY